MENEKTLIANGKKRKSSESRRKLRESTKKQAENLRSVTAKLQRTEQTLHESEEKYRQLVENANCIILRMGKNGKITFFNEFAQKFFGYTERQILGKNIIGTIIPEKDSSGRNPAESIRDIKRHPELYATYENENICKDGRRVWVAWTNKPIRDEQGNIMEILCFGRDITDRKKAEQALLESKQQLSVRSQIAEIFLTVPDDEMYGEVLQVILECMKSKYGIFGYIDEQGVLIIPSMTRDVWEQCQVPDKAITFPRERWGGIWGRALTEKRSLYANEGHPHAEYRRGLPDSHLQEEKVAIGRGQCCVKEIILNRIMNRP